jgi:phosphatidylserine decarboxylase
MSEIPTEIEAVPPRPLPVVPTESAQWAWPSVHREGHKFVAIAAIVTLLVGFGAGLTTIAWLLVGLTIWVAAFFRDPVRVTPADPGAIVSPADGLVSLITQVDMPRQLIGAGGLPPGPCLRVSVFMSVFDVHINRAPIAGVVRRIVYVPGKFLNADLDKASDDNERQYFIIESEGGTAVGITQIAGLVARRVVRAGERIGLIRFGSRLDIYVPATHTVQVAVGQRAIAGETVIARVGSLPLLTAVKQ